MKKELTKNLGYKYNFNYKVTEYKVYRIKLIVISMEGIFRAYAGMSNKKMMLESSSLETRGFHHKNKLG